MNFRVFGSMWLIAVLGLTSACLLGQSPDFANDVVGVEALSCQPEETLSQASSCLPRFSQHGAAEAVPQVLARSKRVISFEDALSLCEHGEFRPRRYRDETDIGESWARASENSLISLKVRLQI
jgi:hypothetical protein